MNPVIRSAVVLSACLWAMAGVPYPHASAEARIMNVPAMALVVVERHKYMTNSDGLKLAADIYHPFGKKKTPTMLVRIPLSNTAKNTFLADFMGRAWAARGYTVVIQTTRGRGWSEGSFSPLRSTERQDGIDSLQWISAQPWFNGKLTTWGGSAFGHTQWAISDQSNPGPSAMHIYEASSDFYSMFYVGGAFSLQSAVAWMLNSNGEADRKQWPSVDEIRKVTNAFPSGNADKRAFGRNVDFFQDWSTHNTRDTYWSGIDGQNRAASVQAPVLLMGGWYDPFLPGMIRDYRTIKSQAPLAVATNTRLIIGPWAHGRGVQLPGMLQPDNFRLAALTSSLDWYDDVLAGKPLSQEAPVKIFVMGKNVWRNEKEWPLARAVNTDFYLRSQGNANGVQGAGVLNTFALSENESISANNSTDTYIYDPLKPVPTAGGAFIGNGSGTARQNAVETRSDVLVYSTPPLNEDVEVTGPVTLILFASTTAQSTDFTAKLVDVLPDGSAYNLSDGIVRTKHRSADAAQIDELKIEMWPTSNVFQKGHRIRLEVSSSNFPRFDRNPNTGANPSTEVNPIIATQTVYHSYHQPSRLVLPIVPQHRTHEH